MIDRPWTVSRWIAAARQAFSEAGLDDPATDARTLVCGLLDLSPMQVITEADRMPSAVEARRLSDAIARRVAREPVHRILGKRGFYGLELRLSPETLEPRPDTEILVDRILALLPEMVTRKSLIRIIDLGTGTGAIALALLKNCPKAVAVGSDISPNALATARANAEINGVAERFQAVQSNWFDAIDGQFDIIVSNPPYIKSTVIDDLAPEVRLFDPMAALDGGDDGLVAYRAIAAQSACHLAPEGLIGVEIGYDQKAEVTKIFCLAGFTFADAAVDYGGRDRVLVFRRDAH